MNAPGGESTRVCALTGASGYVGSILRRALEAAGWQVVALSRRGAPDGDRIPWSLDTVSSSLPRLSLEDALKSRSVSALVHAAWDMALVRPRDQERVNVQGSLRLLAQAKAAHVPRIVFISTISAYLGARSHYGRTKLAVEQAVAECGGVVVRPGLVFDERLGNAQDEEPRGMFRALRKLVGRSSVIPLIGDGRYPQYLVHEDDLATAVVRAVSMADFPDVPVTVAHPHPWSLRALIEEIAGAQGRSPRFVPMPWPLIYSALRLAEAAGCKPGFRSDSVLSLVYQNARPELNAGLLGVEPRAFAAARR